MIYNSQNNNNKKYSELKTSLLILKDKSSPLVKQQVFLVGRIMLVRTEHPFCPLSVPGHCITRAVYQGQLRPFTFLLESPEEQLISLHPFWTTSSQHNDKN